MANSGDGDDGWVQILDGNGYMWNCGENNYGNFGDGTTNNNTQLTKTEVAPGDIVDLWSMCWNGYKTSFIRTKRWYLLSRRLFTMVIMLVVQVIQEITHPLYKCKKLPILKKCLYLVTIQTMQKSLLDD